MGSLYQRGETWWLLYYHNGKRIRESSKSMKKMVAKKLLEQRTGEIAQGKVPGVYFDKVTFDELVGDLLTDYRVNGKKSLSDAELGSSHLAKTFAGVRVTNIDTIKVRKHIEIRQTEGAANTSINRELAMLKRMMNLGVKAGKVDRVPHIPMLRENNVRKGFFEHAEFLALREALPEYLRGFVTFAYRSGWRLSEISNLTWKHVDRAQGIVTLNPGETKNDAARTLYLDDELKAVIEQQWENRKASGKLVPYVFPNRSGMDRIKQFAKTWKRACQTAGISPKLFHDFRRTAIRNMVRAGIPERVAMMISGHKTRSVFDRYNIVSEVDLKLAAERQASYLDEKASIMATIIPIPKKRGAQEAS